MTLCVENTSGFTPLQRAGAALLLESARFGLTLDVGHMGATGGADAAFYRAHAQRVTHLHLHDFRGKEDHLPLGAGAADWRAVLALARANGCRAVVEVKTAEALRASVAALRG